MLGLFLFPRVARYRTLVHGRTLVRGSIEREKCAQCRKSVFFNAMSDGAASLLSGEESCFPQACQVV